MEAWAKLTQQALDDFQQLQQQQVVQSGDSQHNSSLQRRAVESSVLTDIAREADIDAFRRLVRVAHMQGRANSKAGLLREVAAVINIPEGTAVRDANARAQRSKRVREIAENGISQKRFKKCGPPHSQAGTDNPSHRTTSAIVADSAQRVTQLQAEVQTLIGAVEDASAKQRVELKLALAKRQRELESIIQRIDDLRDHPG
ncbi:hypothetical protein DIPPA_33387 [Diplonema papillatum]|nr:hypothetical protein DIPPA_33387 [Diplonema papillatum]